jgi:hypothetical protein
MISDPISRLFWDMNRGALDPEKHARTIIARVLNYGTLRDWQWLERQYGREAVRGAAKSDARSGVRNRSRRLASLLFA